MRHLEPATIVSDLGHLALDRDTGRETQNTYFWAFWIDLGDPAQLDVVELSRSQSCPPI